MTRPTPRPLASVRRLPVATEAPATVEVSTAELAAMRRAITAACRLQREIRGRKARQEHRVPMAELRRLEDRLDQLAEIVKEIAR